MEFNLFLEKKKKNYNDSWLMKLLDDSSNF